ncbi:MAG: pilin, partial [Patescibacteria group bacterium]
GPRGPGCCISETASPPISFGDKVCTNETEECEDGSKIFYSCCVCEQVVDGNRTQKKLPFPRQTRSTCEALCKALDPPGEIFRQAGAGTLATPTVPGAPTAADLKAKEVMCFTQEECATPEYGGSADAFRPGLGCTKGQGKCVAPEPIINLSMPIGGVSTVQGFREFVAVIFKYIMGIVATAAAVMFVWGGFRYIFGSAAGGIERAKEIMIDAAVGLIIALGAVTILQTINPATLKLNALEVFMINRTKFLASEYCADVKSEKPIMFAEAGSRPNYTDVNTAKYEVNQNDARCNQEYYAQGFGEGLCWGRKCDTPGEACVSCKGGGCNDGSDPLGYECQEANFSGTIRYAGGASAKEVELYAVCQNVINDPKSAASIGLPDNGIEQIGKSKLTEAKGKDGTQSFQASFDLQEINDAVKECGDKGKIVGFVLGIRYEDTTTLIGGYDEGAVVGKKNCGGGNLSGYVDGYLNMAQPMHEAAIACGVIQGPLKDVSNYWGLAEIQAVAMGGLPVACNFSLDAASNAPPDPGSKASNTIDMKWAGKDDMKCGTF